MQKEVRHRSLERSGRFSRHYELSFPCLCSSLLVQSIVSSIEVRFRELQRFPCMLLRVAEYMQRKWRELRNSCRLDASRPFPTFFSVPSSTISYNIIYYHALLLPFLVQNTRKRVLEWVPATTIETRGHVHSRPHSHERVPNDELPPTQW